MYAWESKSLVSAYRYKAARWIWLVQRHRFREVGAAVWVPTTTASYRLFPSLAGHPRPSHLQAALLTSMAPTGARSKCYMGKFASVRGNGGQLQRCLWTRTPWRWPCSSWCLEAAMRWHGLGRPVRHREGRVPRGNDNSRALEEEVMWWRQTIAPSLTATDFMPSVETLL
jgi:hypothetical protein